MPVPAEADLAPDAIARALLEAEDSLLAARFQLGHEGLDAGKAERLGVYASWLEGVALARSIEDLDVPRAAFVAGGIREVLFRASGDWSNLDRVLGLSMLLRASTHPHLGIKLAERVQVPRTRGVLQRYSTLIAEVLQGEHLAALRSHERAARRFQRLDPYSLPEDEFARLSTYHRIGEAAARTSWALLSGQRDMADEANARLDDAVRGLPVTLRGLASLWVPAAQAVLDRSVVGELVRAGLDTSYIRLLASDGVLEFWPQQVRAIRSGLLEPSPIVLGLPTGSGKTLLAELAIAGALLGEDGGWGCYLAPSRALVHQVARTLSRRLGPAGLRVRTIVGGPEDTALLGSEMNEFSRSRTLTVATHERVDTYFRLGPEHFEGMKVLVVDEAQLLGDESRGPLLEQLIAKVMVRQPACKVVVLTAAGSNIDELKQWLGESARGSFTDVRVARQELAVAARLRAEPEEVRERSHHGEPRRSYSVPGGLVTAASLRQAEIDDGPIPVSAPGCFSVRVQEKQVNDEWIEIDGGTNAMDHATQMAERLHAAGESTLVFCARQDSARAQAQGLANKVEAAELAELDLVIAAVETRIGSEHTLVDCVRHAVAYHHASLPVTVLRLIERAFQDGLIRTLFATSTLREGVNLPATNVIIAGEKRFDESIGKSIEMPIPDFVNLSGRAGRPQFDRDGLAILIPGKLAVAKQVADRYLLFSQDALAVKSAMQQLTEALSGSVDSVIETLETSHQSLVLSMYASGFRSSRDVGALFASTLAGVQVEFDQDEVSEKLEAGFEYLKQTLGGEYLDSIAKTGLGLEGASAIGAFAENNVGMLTSASTEVAYNEDRADVAVQCVLACRSVPEIWRRDLADESIWTEAALAPLVAGWVSGASYVDLAKLEPFQSKAHPVEAAVSFFTDFAQWIPWPVGALQIALAARGHEASPFVRHLPMYLRFGVPTPVAATLSLAGIFDRQTAIALASMPEFAGTDLSSASRRIQEVLPELGELDAATRAVLQPVFARNRLVELGAAIGTGAERPLSNRPAVLRPDRDGLIVQGPDGSLFGIAPSDSLPGGIRRAIARGPVPAVVVSEGEQSMTLLALIAG